MLTIVGRCLDIQDLSFSAPRNNLAFGPLATNVFSIARRSVIKRTTDTTELQNLVLAFENCGDEISKPMRDEVLAEIKGYLSERPEAARKDIIQKNISDAFMARVIEFAFKGKFGATQFLETCLEINPSLADNWVKGAGVNCLTTLRQHGIEDPRHLYALGLLSKADHQLAYPVSYHTIKTWLHNGDAIYTVRNCMLGDSGLCDSSPREIKEAIDVYLGNISHDPIKTIKAITSALEILAIGVELTHGGAAERTKDALAGIEKAIKPICLVLREDFKATIMDKLKNTHERIATVVEGPLREACQAFSLRREMEKTVPKPERT